MMPDKGLIDQFKTEINDLLADLVEQSMVWESLNNEYTANVILELTFKPRAEPQTIRVSGERENMSDSFFSFYEKQLEAE